MAAFIGSHFENKYHIIFKSKNPNSMPFASNCAVFQILLAFHWLVSLPGALMEVLNFRGDKFFGKISAFRILRK